MIGDPIDILISPITTRTGPTVALPSTTSFCAHTGRTAPQRFAESACSAHPGLDASAHNERHICGLTEQRARQVIDMTRIWLHSSSAPQQMC